MEGLRRAGAHLRGAFGALRIMLGSALWRGRPEAGTGKVEGENLSWPNHLSSWTSAPLHSGPSTPGSGPGSPQDVLWDPWLGEGLTVFLGHQSQTPSFWRLREVPQQSTLARKDTEGSRTQTSTEHTAFVASPPAAEPLHLTREDREAGKWWDVDP